MIHALKTLPEYFEAVIKGEKLFEVRKNDRNYQRGDLLALNEYDKKGKAYTGRSCLVYVDYILNDEKYCKPMFVIMSIKPCCVERLHCPLWIPQEKKHTYEVPITSERRNEDA